MGWAGRNVIRFETCFRESTIAENPYRPNCPPFFFFQNLSPRKWSVRGYSGNAAAEQSVKIRNMHGRLSVSVNKKAWTVLFSHSRCQRRHRHRYRMKSSLLAILMCAATARDCDCEKEKKRPTPRCKMKSASIVDCSMEQGRARARMHRVNHESTISLDHNERGGDNVPEVIFQCIFLMVKLERMGY